MGYKFKPGDKVTVRKDLCTGEEYRTLSEETSGRGLIATYSMQELRGKQVTIISCKTFCGVPCYIVEGSGRSWTDEMFEESKKPLTCRSLL